MHPFVETISIVGGVVIALVAGIIVLSLFFKTLAWLGGRKPDTLSIRGVIGRNTLVTVHMVGGQSFERVQFVGFTASQNMKAHLPWELNGMVILEDELHQRSLVRAKDIKMIAVPPELA
jgi:hypothetical protein